MQVERTRSQASKIASARDTTPYNRQVTGSSPVPPTEEVAVVTPLTCSNAGRGATSWLRPRWRSSRSRQLTSGTLRCTLSVDHRAIDGAVAARWLAAFTARVENSLSLLV
jgi:hypothetical protein